LGRFQVFF